MEGSHFTIFQSLEELENKLVSEFFRINRQFIVNRKAIKDVSKHLGRKLLINLSLPFSEQLIVGKERTAH
jgi:DNA-binding LytR/AlgR family response regulator